MIGGVRQRRKGIRRRVSIQFTVAAGMDGASTTNFNMTVGANGTILVFAAGNVTTGARVDGVAMTLLAKTSNAAMYVATGLAAGSRNVQVDRSGSSSYVVTAAAYTGVSNVTGVVTGNGSGTTLSLTPSGSGALAVAGFDFGVSSGDMANVASNGNLRQVYRRTASNAAAIADKATPPVTLTNPTGGSWTGITAFFS